MRFVFEWDLNGIWRGGGIYEAARYGFGWDFEGVHIMKFGFEWDLSGIWRGGHFYEARYLRI